MKHDDKRQTMHAFAVKYNVGRGNEQRKESVTQERFCDGYEVCMAGYGTSAKQKKSRLMSKKRVYIEMYIFLFQTQEALRILIDDITD